MKAKSITQSVAIAVMKRTCRTTFLDIFLLLIGQQISDDNGNERNGIFLLTNLTSPVGWLVVYILRA